jgi:16S rRNA (guanine527-N7)-methyltransferase
MATAKLEVMVGRYGLSRRQDEQLATVLERLAADERAPTSVREPERAVDVHLADSLAALELGVVRDARAMVDMGAGAGFPGLPLAVALPGAEIVLVDSQARRCAFIARVKAAAGIDNARVVCARLEEWPEGIGAHDVALARALAAPAVVLEYAAPLLKLGGALVDWRGRRDAEEERSAMDAGAQLGMESVSIRRTAPYAGAREHHLRVYTKVRETPERFPRRAGIARKRPLA